MRKVFILMALLSISAVAMGQVVAKYTGTPVKADGKTNEWKRPFDYYDNSTKLMFSVTNDDNNLYLCFESSDPSTHLKVMRAGITVELSSKGKVKRRASVTYPELDKKGKPAAPSGLVPGQKIDMAQAHALFVLNSTNLLLDGFATKNGAQPMKDSLGVHAGMRWDSTNKMVYELVIPYNAFYGANFAPEELGKEITLSVSVNAMERPNFSPGGSAGEDMVNTSGLPNQQYGTNNQPGSAGQNSISGPMGQGGMMGQPGAMGQPNTTMNRPDYPPAMERNVLYERSAFKEKFTLAKKK